MKTGVVHEDIDGAELLDHLLEHGLHLVLFADVGLVRINVRAATHRFLHDGLGGFRTRDVVHDHIGSRVCQRKRDGLANTRVGAGDEGLLSLEDLVNRGSRHHCFGKVLVAEMLLHEVFVRRHGHGPARRQFDFECLVHGLTFDSVQERVLCALVGRKVQRVLTNSLSHIGIVRQRRGRIFIVRARVLARCHANASSDDPDA